MYYTLVSDGLPGGDRVFFKKEVLMTRLTRFLLSIVWIGIVVGAILWDGLKKKFPVVRSRSQNQKTTV